MIIDADTHILPKDAFDYMEDSQRDLGPRYVFGEDGLFKEMEFKGEVVIPGSSPLPAPGTGSRYRGMSNIEDRLDDYRRMGIDKQFLFPQFSSVRISYILDAALGAEMAHSYNLSILRLVKAHPKEFIGGCLVALQDVPRAIEELAWAKGQGFGAVILDKVFPVREHCFGDTLGAHRELWPFFAKCEELRMPVFLHNVTHGHRTSNMGKFQTDGLELFAPVDGQMSLMSLVTSGLFDDFPELNFVFTEAGTAFIEPMVRRFDDAFSVPPVDFDDEDAAPRFQRRIGVQSGKRLTPESVYNPKNRLPPSEYFRKNLHFTIETEEEELADAVAFLGATQFLFATDYPHDDPGGRMKYRDVRLLNENARIGEREKELIFSENAQRLLGEAVGAN